MISKLNFSLTQLEYILAVYRLGHFAKAAESCHVTQPTLSMQIQKLEENLGGVLFDRSKKPILLTEFGRQVIEQIQLVVFEAQKISEILKNSQSEEIHGLLTVGVIPTVAPYLLPLILPWVEKLFPNLQLQMKELQTHQIIHALETDEIDAGILATPTKLPKVFEIPIYYEPFYVFCGKGHELAKSKKMKTSQLKYQDIWLLEEGHCLRHQVLEVCTLKKEKISQARKFNFESGSLETLKKIVASYGGYTLIPHLAKDGDSETTRMIPFEKPIPSREIGLIYRREHHKRRLMEALIQAIHASLPKDIQQLKSKEMDVIPI